MAGHHEMPDTAHCLGRRVRMLLRPPPSVIQSRACDVVVAVVGHLDFDDPRGSALKCDIRIARYLLAHLVLLLDEHGLRAGPDERGSLLGSGHLRQSDRLRLTTTTKEITYRSHGECPFPTA